MKMNKFTVHYGQRIGLRIIPLLLFKIMNGVRELNDESRYCGQYLEYLSILTKMHNDGSIPFYQRKTAGFLGNRLDKYHYNKCINVNLKHG